ncbi:AraC family transcriptional regulator [Chitinophaga sp. OAE865]|uniref:AraC family transcriptional regulator n=1 Tax=Chitinophaga sp. OAE865 TaxID=2817898 RepID=UPI001AE33FCD
MTPITHIRTSYAPVQPFAAQPEETVVYREFLPDLRLQEYIYCYWQLNTTCALTAPFHYRVVADGCMDIFFELHDPRQSFIMGFSDAYTSFPLEGNFNYVGIRFLPGMFPRLFPVNAAELSRQATALDSVAPAIARFLADRFHEETGMPQLRSLLDSFLLAHISKALPADNRLLEAVDLIVQQAGMITLEKELPPGISSRQLRRLFECYIGDTPKAFSKVVRFQKILQFTHSPLHIRKNKLYLDAGYYDQAHFIREFKSLYGLTPAKVFRK